MANYLLTLKPSEARIIFKARLRILDLKTNYKRKYHNSNLCCPFCMQEEETFDHIFNCNDGLACRNNIKNTTLSCLDKTKDHKFIKSVAKFLILHNKVRDKLMES